MSIQHDCVTWYIYVLRTVSGTTPLTFRVERAMHRCDRYVAILLASATFLPYSFLPCVRLFAVAWADPLRRLKLNISTSLFTSGCIFKRSRFVSAWLRVEPWLTSFRTFRLQFSGPPYGWGGDVLKPRLPYNLILLVFVCYTEDYKLYRPSDPSRNEIFTLKIIVSPDFFEYLNNIARKCLVRLRHNLVRGEPPLPRSVAPECATITQRMKDIDKATKFRNKLNAHLF